MVGKPQHGGSYTRLYKVWCQMKYRCDNPSHQVFHNYGGRGIKVCDEWANSFDAFRAWADAAGYSQGLTIDRIDNDGPYAPDNCRWVDMKIQCGNQRKTVKVSAFGETKALYAWTRDKRCKVPKEVLRQRILAGWDHEQALTAPSKSWYNWLTAFGETKPQNEWAKDPRCKCHKNTLDYRLRRGWPLEQALTTPPKW